jgi:hypothetical protein
LNGDKVIAVAGKDAVDAFVNEVFAESVAKLGDVSKDDKPVIDAALAVAKDWYLAYLDMEFEFWNDTNKGEDPVNSSWGLKGRYGPADMIGVYNDSDRVGSDIIRFDGDILNLIYHGSDDLGYTKSAMSMQSKFHELMNKAFGEGEWDFSASYSVSVSEDAVAKVKKKAKRKKVVSA